MGTSVAVPNIKPNYKVSKREAKLIIVTGRKRIGKSNETLRYLFNEYVKGIHPRKVLIFDPNNEYGNYRVFDKDQDYIVKVDMIGHNDIMAFNKQKQIEMRRIVPINNYGKPLMPDEQDELIVKMMVEFRGGCLFIDDLNTVFGDTLPKKVSGFFSNNAHRDCDILMQMQSVGRVLPKMWQNTNGVRFHKQLDSIKSSKGKLQDDYEIFQIAEQLVNFQYKNGNKRFFVWVDKDENKIRGAFNKPMFERAIIDYLEENPGILRAEMDRVDLSALVSITDSPSKENLKMLEAGVNKKKNTLEAVNDIKKRLFEEFYGNPK